MNIFFKKSKKTDNNTAGTNDNTKLSNFIGLPVRQIRTEMSNHNDEFKWLTVPIAISKETKQVYVLEAFMDFHMDEVRLDLKDDTLNWENLYPSLEEVLETEKIFNTTFEYDRAKKFERKYREALEIMKNGNGQ